MLHDVERWEYVANKDQSHSQDINEALGFLQVLQKHDEYSKYVCVCPETVPTSNQVGITAIHTCTVKTKKWIDE